MPANILADMNSLGAGLEDQRALQIALELTKLGLNENDSSQTSRSAAAGSTPGSNSGGSSSAFERENEASLIRRSANMTECVPVPSSEHVAEIVGRQGCKIKALRAKTNTYIKTPVRGEEPVFVVTGRKEDVGSAKREILSAAEHFSQIRASRRNNNSTGVPGVGGGVGGGTGGVPPGPTNPSLPGQVTIQVRVPYRVVGLVVGPKGATIKRIQQQTHTYIVTPNRDKEPIFEVTGLPENVEKARQEIEGHIAMRTGGVVDGNMNNHMNNLHSSMSNLNMMHSGVPGPGVPGSKTGLEECRTDFHSNGIDAGFHEISNNMLFSSIYNNKSPNLTTSAFTPYSKLHNNNNNLLSQRMDSSQHRGGPDARIFAFPPPMDGSSLKYGPGECVQMTEGCGSVGLYDSDEGIGGSPTFESTPVPLPSASIHGIWSDLTESQHAEFGTFLSSLSSAGTTNMSRQNLALSSTAPMSLPAQCYSSVGLPSLAGSDLTCATRSDSCLPNTDHSAVRRLSNDPLTLATTLAMLHSGIPSSIPSSGSPGGATSTSVSGSLSSSTVSSLHSDSASSSPTEPTADPLPPRGRHCIVCNDLDIVAALVPCGHNMLCMDCAKQLVEDKGQCPLCQQTPSQAIRIFS